MSIQSVPLAKVTPLRNETGDGRKIASGYQAAVDVTGPRHFDTVTDLVRIGVDEVACGALVSDVERHTARLAQKQVRDLKTELGEQLDGEAVDWVYARTLRYVAAGGVGSVPISRLRIWCPVRWMVSCIRVFLIPFPSVLLFRISRQSTSLERIGFFPKARGRVACRPLLSAPLGRTS